MSVDEIDKRGKVLLDSLLELFLKSLSRLQRRRRRRSNIIDSELANFRR